MRILSTVVQNHHRFLLWSLPQLSLSFLIRPRAQQTFATKACSLQSPRCDCEDLTIPADLDIDRQTLLLGTIAAYDTHVLVSTGKSDWNSKIELEMGLAAGIKGVLGKAGLNKGHEDLRHPDNIVLTTNSSYPPSPSISTPQQHHSSAYVFPQNLYIPTIPLSSPMATESAPLAHFIRTYLLPTSPPPSTLVRVPELPYLPRKVHETHILVCTHHSRDSRCGIIGPILNAMFTRYLSSRGLLHPDDHTAGVRGKVRVGNISHIGGHKYAGNVVVYLPPEEENWDRGGRGIWYGRVSGKADVQRIVDETVMKGNIIEELLRGAIGK